MRQHSTHHSHSMPASFQHFQVPSPRLSTNTNFSTGDRGGIEWRACMQERVQEVLIQIQQVGRHQSAAYLAFLSSYKSFCHIGSGSFSLYQWFTIIKAAKLSNNPPCKHKPTHISTQLCPAIDCKALWSRTSPCGPQERE